MTLIKENFVGTLWEEDAKAAVSYACRLMEEYLPTMYPIKINMVREESIYVDYVKTRAELYLYNGLVHPRAGLKRSATIHQTDDNFMYYGEAYNTLGDASIYFSPDDIFSTRLDGEVEYDKYDLVTVTLRELAKALVMCSSVSQTGKNELSIYIDWFDEHVSGQYMTPYTQAMLDSELSTSAEFYNYFTSNDVAITSRHSKNSINIYAPNEFNRNVSLLYFAEDPDNKETLLFQPTLPKGTAIHHIGSGFKTLLRHMGWYYVERPTGIDTPLGGQCKTDTTIYDGTTEFVITSGGNVSNKQSQTTIISKRQNNISKQQEYLYDENATLRDVFPYMQEDGVRVEGEYGVYNDDAIIGSTLFAINKDDGSLVPVAHSDISSDIRINIDEAMNERYARTSDGLLRFRYNNNNLYVPEVNSAVFFNVGFYPVKPKLSLKKHYLKTAPVDPDSYYEDITIAFSNMEGITSATMIETVYDNYGPLSTTTYPVDISSGNFIATTDKEFKTTYQIVVQNAYGTTKSDLFVVLPKANLDTYDVEVVINNDILKWRFIDALQQPVNIITQELQLINIANPVISIKQFTSDNQIDVQTLPQGVYNLKIKDTENNIYNKKIVKI